MASREYAKSILRNEDLLWPARRALYSAGSSTILQQDFTQFAFRHTARVRDCSPLCDGAGTRDGYYRTSDFPNRSKSSEMGLRATEERRFSALWFRNERDLPAAMFERPLVMLALLPSAAMRAVAIAGGHYDSAAAARKVSGEGG